MNDYARLLMDQAGAFSAKDADALGEVIAPDFASFLIKDGAPQQRTANRDETIARMRQMFAAVPLMGSRLQQVMVVGDHVVAVEKDTYSSGGGEKTTTTLGVYHMKDGKIWRAYSFPIAEE